jgi:hypothetical protein
MEPNPNESHRDKRVERAFYTYGLATSSRTKFRQILLGTLNSGYSVLTTGWVLLPDAVTRDEPARGEPLRGQLLCGWKRRVSKTVR